MSYEAWVRRTGMECMTKQERGLRTTTTLCLQSRALARVSFFELPFLCHLTTGSERQVPGLWNQFERLRHLGIAFKENAAGIRYTKAVVVDFVFDGTFH